MGLTEPARAVMNSGFWANLHGDLAGGPQRRWTEPEALEGV